MEVHTHWCIEACKLCHSRFQKFCNAFNIRPAANCHCFYWIKSRICWLVFYQSCSYCLVFVCLASKSHLHVRRDERNHKKTTILSCHEANRILLLLCKSNVDEKHTLKQCTTSYFGWSPSYDGSLWYKLIYGIC